MSEITLQPATAQLALLRAASLSPVELAEAHIVRIERCNPALRAFVDFDPELVRAQARLCAAQPAGERGPLWGLPVSIKSSIAVAGRRCELGSLLHKGQRPPQDAAAVAQLRRAGAILLGITNCPEFLMAYDTENRLHGQTANPWDLTRTPGGSSGGESAAIAAGLSPAGLGSDSGGSVRVPAHFTGICALKPTPGRVPSSGHIPPNAGPFTTLGAIGPMARTVQDLQLLFSVLHGAAEGPPVPLRPFHTGDPRTIRIAVLEDDGGLTPVADGTRQAVHAASEVLRAAMFHVEHLAHGHPLYALLERARALWAVFFTQCGAMLFEPGTRGHQELLSPTFLDFLARAHSYPPLSADSLLRAWVEADQLRAELLCELERYPLVLSPVCATPAFPHGARLLSTEAGPVDYLDAMRYTQWWNLLGAPAVVLPVSYGPLPVGVQLAGAPWHDERVLAVAAVLDRAFGYRPPPDCSTWNTPAATAAS